MTQEQDTIVVRLPPKVMIADSEERLSQPGATYPLPPFYKRLFNGMDPVIPGMRNSACMPSVSAIIRSASVPETT